MLRPLLSIVFLITCSPTASADLRYTTRVEVRRTSTALRPDAAAIDALLQALMPTGETRTFVSGGAIRIEQTIGTTRSVVLMRSDGQFVVYPDVQAYWRIPTPGGLLADSRSSGHTTFRRTGEFITMLGVRAERIPVTLPIALPVTPPAGFPTRMTFEGELWVADAYRAEARGIQNTLGLTVLPPGVEGMVLRQVLRNAEFGYEVESTVVELDEAPIPPDMFIVPAGYREINQPVVPDVAPGGSRRRQP